MKILKILIISLLLSGCTKNAVTPVAVKTSEDPLWLEFSSDVEKLFKNPRSFKSPSIPQIVIDWQKNNDDLDRVTMSIGCGMINNSILDCKTGHLEKYKIDSITFIHMCANTFSNLRKRIRAEKVLTPEEKNWAARHLCTMQKRGCDNFKKCLDSNGTSYFSVWNITN